MTRRPLGENDDHKKGLLIATIGGILFTLDIPLLRLANPDGSIDHWTLIFARGIFLFTAIFLWWYFFRWRTHREPFLNGWPGIAVAGTNTLANILFIAAIGKTTAANLVFILALNPIFAAVLAWLVLKEDIPVWTWLAVILSFIGVGIIVWDGLETGTWVGDIMALIVAMCTAVALTIIRKTGRNVVTSLATGSLVSALIALTLAPTLYMPASSWSWVMLNGLIVMPVASGLIAISPRYIPSAEVAMFFLLDTVLTPIWIWLLFGEVPTPRAMVGGAIVIATLFAHSLWRLYRYRLTVMQASPAE
ncbi:DMT family transporter [Thermopetrobacter sp. TC1]|uniref:DMT family transporter n=1 Tax=Thermopetrobacter sp. TC1 TaxID=1495045 RepID=UPI00056E8FCC|nr:DMT family transporter [Thermopetrobacter sp. TC1]